MLLTNGRMRLSAPRNARGACNAVILASVSSVTLWQFLSPSYSVWSFHLFVTREGPALMKYAVRNESRLSTVVYVYLIESYCKNTKFKNSGTWVHVSKSSNHESQVAVVSQLTRSAWRAIRSGYLLLTLLLLPSWAWGIARRRTWRWLQCRALRWRPVRCR